MEVSVALQRMGLDFGDFGLRAALGFKVLSRVWCFGVWVGDYGLVGWSTKCP